MVECSWGSSRGIGAEPRLGGLRLKEDGVLLVYFYTVDWRWYLPAAEELERSLSLHVLAWENDGVIY